MINQPSFKNTENHMQDFETGGAKTISKCMKCKGKPHPWTSNRYMDLIKMVEYFELNPEDAEC